MKKRRSIDFVLHEGKDERILFRFYPRSSSCHGFGDEPPKSRQGVYKVYFNYRIIQQYLDSNGAVDCYYILFDSRCDECSCIDQVAFCCKQIAKGVNKRIDVDGEYFREVKYTDEEIMAFGMGVNWIIGEPFPSWNKEKYYCNFQLFRWDGVGYRFTLPFEKVHSFGEYLDRVVDYMVEHGDPI